MGALLPIVAIVLVGLSAGCATTPEQRAATEQAWAERDSQRAAECAQTYPNAIYVSGSCVLRGGMPGAR